MIYHLNNKLINWVHLKFSLAGEDTSQGSQSAAADVLTAHGLESKATILNAPDQLARGLDCQK